MTSTSSRPLNWPLVLLAAVGLVVCAPILFALLMVGLALTVGLAATLLKVGAVLLVLWAVVTVFKGLFGHRQPGLPKPLPRVAPEPRVRPAPRIESAPRVDLEAELLREHRESLAALDRELALAIARKQEPAAP